MKKITKLMATAVGVVALGAMFLVGSPSTAQAFEYCCHPHVDYRYCRFERHVWLREHGFVRYDRFGRPIVVATPVYSYVVR